MEKIIAGLIILFFFGTALGQQTLQSQPAPTSGNNVQESDQEIELTVELQTPSMQPIESLCRDLIIGYQHPVNGTLGVTASSILFPIVVLGAREAIGNPINEQYQKDLFITSGSVASASAIYHIIHMSRVSSLKSLEKVIEQSQMCIQYKLCSDENFEAYAEHVISENVDIEKFSGIVQNNTHSFCKTEKKANGTYSVRIKSGRAIKKILQDRYRLAS
jgi:hypothetical protein